MTTQEKRRVGYAGFLVVLMLGAPLYGAPWLPGECRIPGTSILEPGHVGNGLLSWNGGVGGDSQVPFSPHPRDPNVAWCSMPVHGLGCGHAIPQAPATMWALRRLPASGSPLALVPPAFPRRPAIRTGVDPVSRDAVAGDEERMFPLLDSSGSMDRGDEAVWFGRSPWVSIWNGQTILAW